MDQEKAGKRRMLICITGFAALGLIVGLILVILQGYESDQAPLSNHQFKS